MEKALTVTNVCVDRKNSGDHNQPSNSPGGANMHSQMLDKIASDAKQVEPKKSSVHGKIATNVRQAVGDNHYDKCKMPDDDDKEGGL